MSSVVKALVERLVSDPGFRKAFIDRPREILNAHVMSLPERRALIRARRRLVLAGSGQQIPPIPLEWP
jgi:hypothetical protein